MLTQRPATFQPCVGDGGVKEHAFAQSRSDRIYTPCEVHPSTNC